MRASVIDVELDIGLEWSSSGFGQQEVEKAVDAAVKFAGLPGLADHPSPIEVNIKLSDNDEVQALNREWRDKDKPTNVLSFPMLDDDELEALNPPRTREGGGPERTDGGGSALATLFKASPPLHHPADGPPPHSGEEPMLLLGDIILAYGICADEAAEKAIPLAHHATHLVIHGMLHLLGHDHIDDEDAEAMEALEVKALASMGLNNPYSD
jgi:probable rRNA maturation factor